MFEAARTAVATLKQTFEEFWLPIGKAVRRAREIADQQRGKRGSGKAFMRLLEQQGLTAITSKTTASKLLNIMKHLPAVEKWRATLTEHQKIEWAAPSSVLANCPYLKKKPKKVVTEPPPLPPVDPPPASALENIESTVASVEISLSENLSEIDADYRMTVLEQLVSSFSDDEIEAILSARRGASKNQVIEGATMTVEVTSLAETKQIV